MANFEEIGLENYLSNFLSVHLTNRYSVNMADHNKPGGIRHHGVGEVSISHMFLRRNGVKFQQQVGEYAVNG